MQKLRVLELFAGIGACSKALERLNIPHEIVDAVEIDKYAIKSFNAIHGTNFEPQDITTWNKNIDVDLIMHGSPCQDFSLAGKQAGGDEGSGTRSSLMYETLRIVEKLKPKYVVWENVKNLLSKKHKHNFDAYLEQMKELGYTSYYQVLNAKDYGIPQNRERVFTISIFGNENYMFPNGDECQNSIKVVGNYMPSGHNASRIVDENGLAPTVKENHGTVTAVLQNFEFPPKQELGLKLKDILDNEIDEKYYLSDTQVNRIKTSAYTSNNRRIQKKEWCDTLCAKDWKDPKCVQVGNLTGGNTEPKVVVDDEPRKDIKKLDKNCEYCGKQLERKRFNGRLEDFTVFSNRKYCNRECMKRDFLKIGEHHQSYSNAHTTARKINELILHKEVCELCGSNTNLDIHHIDGNWQNNNLDNLMCLCRSCHTRYERNKDKTELRIRKLTPREVWRLMGFDDSDFEKAEKINSNTQLYKQAGNSIVVNVLEAIFKELFKEYIPNVDKWSDLD